jgi:hypothetical protein
MALVTISADQEVFEVGAQLMGILAFPEDPERARAAADAWCAEMIQADVAVFSDTAEIVRANYPKYASMPEWEIRRALRGAKTRLRYRAIAARMSRGFFFENIFRTPADLPEGMSQHSLNQLSLLVSRESRQSDPENTEKRMWRSSRRIIHLATAFDQIANAQAANDNDFHIADFKLMKRVLELAELHEQIVLKDRRFGVSSDELIRVRVA